MKKRGFTLIELSIVLVIIGLLIGGILVARSMIGVTKIQAQIRQLQEFDIAVTNFYTKFNQIPGDCKICNHMAQSQGYVWPEGNNNGILEDQNGASPPVRMPYEPFFFFPDLHQMGIISQNYVFNTVPSSAVYNLGEGSPFPAAAIGRGAISVTGNAFGNVFYLFTIGIYMSGYFTDAMAGAGTGAFSGAEAQAIDTKIDDGKVWTGNVYAAHQNINPSTSFQPLAGEWYDNTCLTNSPLGLYNVTNPTTSYCRLVIKSNFQK